MTKKLQREPSASLEIIYVPFKNRNLIDRFIKVPWHIYKNVFQSTYWVPPLLHTQRQFLDMSINPFFEHAKCALWIARKNNVDVGRIAAVDDADWSEASGKRAGYFGFFESPNDTEVANALLDKAYAWLMSRSLHYVIGPLSLSANHQSGLLVKGFDSLPCVEMPYNPPYYEDLLKNYGFKECKELWQWRIDASTALPARVKKLAQRIKLQNQYNIRPADINDWDAEVDRILDIYNDAWADQWGFTQLSDKELRYIATNLKFILQPELTLLAEIDNEPVAICMTVKDINPLIQKINGRLFPIGLIRLLWNSKFRRKVTSGRLIIAGIKKGHRLRGIGTVMYVETHAAIAKLGWNHVDVGWTLEDNNGANNAIKYMGGKKVKSFRIYRKDF